MTSGGGMIPATAAATRAASLALSGPAGGVVGAAAVLRAARLTDALTIDIGGTSADAGLILGGEPLVEPGGSVAGVPIALPRVLVETVSAGGGSVAWVDRAGALRVGPQSAGAVPGPVAFGRGGTEPTVTDAHIALGRLDAAVLSGGVHLDRTAAEAAVATLARALNATVERTAAAIVAIADASVARALRRVSVERGVDPRACTLVAFGGGGPLHACALADALGMPAVIVPARAGVLSAVGILGAPLQHDLVLSWPTPADHDGVDRRLDRLALRAAEELAAWLGDDSGWVNWSATTGRFVSGEGVHGHLSTALDCRYAGQSHELRVPSVAAFHEEHESRNGYARPDEPVEVVALRATATVDAPLGPTDLPLVPRAGAMGPAVIAEDDCTIWVPEGWWAEPGHAGALVLRRTAP
jgi:N-methylhydantoinase A/oxoprolinase/acetone carboxylase beta subunit